MTDRLRRLDALFAERVLGFVVTNYGGITLPRAHDMHRGSPNDGWYMAHPPTRGHILSEGGSMLVPSYTRSLDAAWEGMQTDKFSVFEVRQEPDCECEAEVALSDNPGFTSKFAYSENYPAEALVIACLRAVGVTEDELRAAEAEEEK